MTEIENKSSASKTVILAAIIFLIIVELTIYTIAASMSGTEYRVIIQDREGHVLYETPGKHLTRYEELSFQNRYGPVENYIVRVVSQERPFPFRAWLAASIGIPIGAILMLAFLVRGYLAIFERKTGNKLTDEETEAALSPKLFLHKYVASLSLFHVGVVVLVLLIALWIIPNALSEITGKVVSFFERHPFFSAAVFIFVAGVILWTIYLRYRLSQETVRYQFELARMRLEQKALKISEESSPELPDKSSSIAIGKISDERRDHHDGMV